MNTCVSLEGKKAACDDPEIIPLLVQLIREFNEEVRARAAGALMIIAITTKGKLSRVLNNIAKEKC